MPESIAKFEVVDADSFIFGLKGMPEIKLRMKEKTANSKIVLGAASDKLPFTLTATIYSISNSSSEVQFLFEGEFNAMMAMMIKGPISKFIETLAENIKKYSKELTLATFQMESEVLTKKESDEIDSILCPKCNSKQITYNKQGFGVGKALVGAVLTGGIGLLAGGINKNKIILTCLKCGHTWNRG
jgi:DNA-directed RNA polymerase subunit M/transcription elongation factor TFIIS